MTTRAHVEQLLVLVLLDLSKGAESPVPVRTQIRLCFRGA